jgi:hypothetical protein
MRFRYQNNPNDALKRSLWESVSGMNAPSPVAFLALSVPYVAFSGSFLRVSVKSLSEESPRVRLLIDRIKVEKWP